MTDLQAQVDPDGPITWDVASTRPSAQHAAGARKWNEQKAPPGGECYEPAEHGLGRSRGGLTTKLHLAVEQDQKPMALEDTAGQRGDSPQLKPVPQSIRAPRSGGGRPRTRLDRVRANKGVTRPAVAALPAPPTH
ncbi:hypothetical protein [Actinomadura rugatobispora]|uniref:Transposase n=1 Tax=Actinomadura rugatobispora TaxID=1994 RepID=A0ABW0ZY05_9ACTN|nr:hypothetical protein GCM10010200_097290 [Actinomadura rugatobispora]